MRNRLGYYNKAYAIEKGWLSNAAPKAKAKAKPKAKPKAKAPAKGKGDLMLCRISITTTF
jgi:hypothetical protein